jgi:hypothetical protein
MGDCGKGKASSIETYMVFGLEKTGEFSMEHERRGRAGEGGMKRRKL